uniref:Uncharacterized protein n=1 Tax=Pyxicephalus adspersus TaxID=30357 RepID=A0AAV3B577_PYXAD|nr:TPA: hypothetical protein GDO54_006188 [Pyxicephalus adspersus]
MMSLCLDDVTLVWYSKDPAGDFLRMKLSKVTQLLSPLLPWQYWPLVIKEELQLAPLQTNKLMWQASLSITKKKKILGSTAKISCMPPLFFRILLTIMHQRHVEYVTKSFIPI